MTRQPYDFVIGASTDVGRVRRENEDSYLVLPQRGVFAVADGMGGHEAGAVASTAVVDSLRSIGRPATMTDLLEQCRERLSRANRELREIAARGSSKIIGTTVATLLAWEGCYACVWSGDSRIYLVQHGNIQQLTRDHSEVAELVAEGLLSAEQARTWPRRNVITRAVGVRSELELEVVQGVLEKGDTFIVCSDGLTAHVSDREILEHAIHDAPQVACDSLVALTIERGGTDNVTVIVARYAPSGSTVVFP